MRKLISILIAVSVLSSCALLQATSWDEQQLAMAASSALTAASISNAQIVALSQQTVAQLDAQNAIDKGTYDQRLKKLLSGVTVKGLDLNYKVYQTKEINAFACGDGSIRVYSGLMDVMNDDELMAIIGHEIGHVVHQDTKKAMKNAYLAAAARGLLGSAGSIGAIASSSLGDLGEAFVSSQYSQKQEFQADDYGFQFAIATGHDKYSMYSALNKLVSLSSGTQASRVQKMFSSHPDSAERAAKIKAKADALK